MRNDGCSKQWRVARVLATSLLSGGAMGVSDDGSVMAYPPVVEYGREFQAQAAEMLALLPEGSAVAEMLADCAVMREQTRACASR